MSLFCRHCTPWGTGLKRCYIDKMLLACLSFLCLRVTLSKDHFLQTIWVQITLLPLYFDLNKGWLNLYWMYRIQVLVLHVQLSNLFYHQWKNVCNVKCSVKRVTLGNLTITFTLVLWSILASCVKGFSFSSPKLCDLHFSQLSINPVSICSRQLFSLKKRS